MENLHALKKPPIGENLVVELERLLADAKAGKITGIFIFTEEEAGVIMHTRNGMSDALVLFWLAIIQRRILAEYA